MIERKCACGAVMSRNSKQCRKCKQEGDRGRRRSKQTRERQSAAARERWKRKRGCDLTKIEIKKRLKAGATLTEIAASVGCSRATVSIVFNYGSWAEYHRQKTSRRPSAEVQHAQA